MTYIVGPANSAPHFVLGRFTDFEAKVPDLKHRVEVADVFKNGTRLLRAEEIPEHLQLNRPIRSFRDAFRSDSGAIIISRALHDLLEELDPGIHQSSSITLDHLPAAGERFVLNVHFKQDSIVDEKSSVQRHPSTPESSHIMFISFLAKGVNVTIDRSCLSNVNLWREMRYPGSMLLSDALRDEMKGRELKFFEVFEGKNI